MKAPAAAKIEYINRSLLQQSAPSTCSVAQAPLSLQVLCRNTNAAAQKEMSLKQLQLWKQEAAFFAGRPELECR